MDTENLVLTVLGGLDQRLLFGALHDLPDALALGDFQLFQKVIQYRIQPVGGDFHPKSLNTHCHTFSHRGSYTGAHKTVILKIMIMASVMQGWQRNNGYPVSAGYPLFFCRYEKQ